MIDLRNLIARMVAAVIVLGLLAPLAAGAQTSATATVKGTTRDRNGGPLPAASLVLVGPQTYRATSGADGSFSLGNVAPGLYQITVSHAGFQSEVLTDYPVIGGETYNVDVGLAALSLSSIQEIGRVQVSARSRSSLNISAAASNPVPAQLFADQAQHQIIQVLDEQPGYITAHESANGNPAGPGAAQYPNVRGSLTYETASLVDGHPVARSQGGYRTQYLNPALFDRIEVVQGPGATVPNINYAIGGAVNFRTVEPTSKPAGSLSLGFDTWGSQTFDFRATGSGLNGRLGYAVVYADNGARGAAWGFQTRIPLLQYSQINGVYVNNNPITAGPSTVNGYSVANPISTGATTLYACCVTVNDYLQDTAELLKLRYKISSATTVTGTYLGTHGRTDENGNHLWQDPVTFNPATGPVGGYSDVLAGGTTMLDTNYVPPAQVRRQNEPIYMLDLRTTVGNDTILGRYFAAVTDNFATNDIASAAGSATQNLAIYGTFTGCAAGYAVGSSTCLGPTAPVTYNGQVVPVTYGPLPTNFPVCYEPGSTFTPAGGRYNNRPDPSCVVGGANYVGYNGTNGGTGGPTPINAFFASNGRDALQGGSFEYDHYVGSQAYSLSLEQTKTNSQRFNYFGDPNGMATAPGTFFQLRTAMFRANNDLGSKLHSTVSLYLNHYENNTSSDNGFTFTDVQYNHFDGRLGLTLRPDANSVWRFAMGSSIAPPYIDLLDASITPQGAGTGAAVPTCASGICTQTLANPFLKPETAFGYDLGASIRFNDPATLLDFDLYRTNLFNQFVNGRQLTGTFTPAGGSPLPLYTTQWTNIANARYEGINIALRRTPAMGFGYVLSGALQRAFPYNISPTFYGNNFNTNLAVVPNVNYLVPGDGTGVNQGINGIARNNIPYAQGYGELSYRSALGGLIFMGVQYYGNNNSFNEPAFGVLLGGISFSLNGDTRTKFQINGYNLTNALNLPYVIQGAGLQEILVNGKTGITNAQYIGPRKFSFSLTRTFGAP